MYKVILTTLLIFLLCSCSSPSLQMVELTSPSRAVQGLLRYEPTLENVIANSTHVAKVTLKTIKPYDGSGSVFTFSVDSLLLGELNSDVIDVLAETAFFKHGETYLLFLNCHSSTLWPYDIYVPFDLFIFRVTDDHYIDCLQDAEERLFVPPFVDEEHNTYAFLSEYIQQNTNYISSYPLASDNKDMAFLSNAADIIVEIRIIDVTPVNPFINDIDYEIDRVLKGSMPPGTNLLLPSMLAVGSNYIVFLEMVDTPDNYKLVTRNSIFPQGSKNYIDFKVQWEN